MIKVTTPLHIKMGRKNYAINLNTYRNLYYVVNNNLKREFKRIIHDQIKDLKFDRVEMEFKLFYKDKRKRDKFNIVSITEKYFMDALVECGALKDDNDDYVGEVIVKVPEIDKENPRCEITIKTI